MSLLELWMALLEMDAPARAPYELAGQTLYSACDADPGYVHRITGIRVVGEKVVFDIDTTCQAEKLES